MIWEIDDGVRAIEGLDEHGRPDPEYAASLGLRAAGRGARVLAALIEWFLGALICVPALIVLIPLAVEILGGGFDVQRFTARADLIWIIVAVAASQVLMTAYIVVQLVLHGRKGVTLGKAVCGLRSVNVRTLESPGFWRGAVVRYLVAYASFVVPVFGPLLVIALSPLFDVERRGRGWLDLVAATWFVDIRRGLNPYDQKRMRIARKTVKTPEHEGRAPLPSLATPVDRDAPASYTPSARLSGGVIGAHLAGPTQAPAGEEPSGRGMVSSVPPSLATGAAGPSSPAPRPAEPQAAPLPVPQPAPSPAVRTHPAEPSLPTPPTSSPTDAAAGNAPSDVRAVLVLDGGERIEVRGTTLFGRAPSAAAGEGEAQLVSVRDDTRSVSKTHVAVVPGRRGVFVIDRASTNGSAVVRDGAETALAAGQPVELRAGDVVRFGDRTMRVERI